MTQSAAPLSPRHGLGLAASILLLAVGAACSDSDSGGDNGAGEPGGCAATCETGDVQCLLDNCGPYAVDGDGDRTPLAEDCDDADASRHRGAEEVCDGIDNDCDREIDEGCDCNDGDQRECGTSIGACSQGHQTCVAGRWGACDGLTMPQPEVCDDRIDNDCDGAIDNGCECTVTPTSGSTTDASELSPDDRGLRCGLQDGACRPGVQLCRENRLSGCLGSLGPTTELCDGVDNDCDGSVDEDCPCAPGAERPCGTAIGVCEAGTQSCNNGRWSSCEGRIGPSPELCDELDNDCDGDIDEDFRELQTQCNVGLGECFRIGRFVCDPATGGIACDTLPGRPRAEVCDGLDNDCDGDTDESFPQLDEACDVGVGECRREGRFECNDTGEDVECSAIAAVPDTELCDQKDNDCDGETDENFLLVGFACFVGEGGCTGEGEWVCSEDQTGVICNAEPLPPRPEDCDSIDNDCDGETDEDLIRDCSTICGEGVEVCLLNRDGSEWTSCTAPVPDQEICDGIDNDCDGLTDEDFPQLLTICEVGIGACHSVGYRVCASDGIRLECTAVAGIPEADEACGDGVDNNCDGETDGDDCSSCRQAGGDLPGWMLTIALLIPLTVRRRRRWLRALRRATGIGAAALGLFLGHAAVAPQAAQAQGFACERPNMLVVLDRSGSMSSNNRWDIAKDAIRAIVTTFEGRVRFGLDLFPSDNSCRRGDIVVDLGDGNTNVIIDTLETYSPTGATPMGATLAHLNSYLPLKDPTRRNFVVFITDGDETCGGEGLLAVTSLRSNGVRTFVVGFGGGVNSQALNEMAQAGGVPRPPGGGGGDRFYAADNATELQQSLDQIIAVTLREICDNRDNDCDGLIDEDFTEKNQLCSTEQGGCQASGAFVCNPVGDGVECNARLDPQPEICDGRDNDCDGDTDEGVAQDRDGDNWTDCGGDCDDDDPALNPGAQEVCDGVDNNCNNRVDEDDPQAGRDCTPSPDAVVCRPGTFFCLNGGLVCTGVVEPLPEICDGIDNDCDGETDENAQPENCKDGLDNDCDGRADGFDDECGECNTNDERECGISEGACVPGTEICDDRGKWSGVCQGAVEQREETCDGLDNDCDGTTDEGDFLCIGGGECLCGRCAEPCVRDACLNPAETCVDGLCLLDPCCGSDCPANTRCVPGAEGISCVNPCTGDEDCADDEDCRLGECVPQDCFSDGNACPSGEVCIEGQCLADPCDGVNCNEGQYCASGICLVVGCTDCDDTEVCRQGRCVRDACGGVDCAAGRICRDGECSQDPCIGIACTVGFTCVDGVCVDDPCSRIDCPEGSTCSDGACIGPMLPPDMPDGGMPDGGPDPTEPPVTEPPVTDPPVTDPPVTEPPVTDPPVTDPPVTQIASPDPTPSGGDSGCGCQSTSPAQAGLYLMIVALFALLRRRQ